MIDEIKEELKSGTSIHNLVVKFNFIFQNL